MFARFTIDRVILATGRIRFSASRIFCLAAGTILPPLFLLAFACAAPARVEPVRVEPPTRQVFHRPTGISLRLPLDWTARSSRANDTVLIQGWSRRAYQGDFRENITLVMLDFPEAFTVKEIRAANLREIAGRYPAFRLEDSGSFSGDGVKAGWAVIEVTVDGFPLKDKIYYFVQNQRGFVLTCSGVPGNFARFEKIFDRIAGSLRIAVDQGS